LSALFPDTPASEYIAASLNPLPSHHAAIRALCASSDTPSTACPSVLTVTITDLNPTGTVDSSTAFNVVTPNGIKSGVSTLQGLLYYLDSFGSPTVNGETSQGVVFHAAPEPASLGLLAAGTAFLFRSRHR
jgi:hypothetical protein